MSYLPREAEDGSVGPRAERRQERKHDTRRFLGLTALGTLIPGAGLALTRRRRYGYLLLGLFVCGLLALAVYVWRRGVTDSALNLAVRPNLLMALTVVVIVAAAVWVCSIVYTAHVATPPDSSRTETLAFRAFTVALCLIVIAPTVQAVRYMQIQRDVVHTVFTGGKHRGGSGNAPVATPEVEKKDPWENVPRVNVLLLGSDQGPDRRGTGVRTDSMIVASIDTHTGNAVLFGVPRNLQDVPFPKSNPLHKLYPNGFDCGSECLMDAVWNQARAHKDLFGKDPNPGLTTTQDVLSEILGLPIDYTLIMDLHGFTELVDAMGGVDIDVKERLPIGGEVIPGVGVKPGSIDGWIEPGEQHLNGKQALWYSRSRATTDDYSRMRRQRCMVGALLTQVNPIMILKKYPSLAKVAQKNIQTDIAADELPAWVELVERIQHGEIHSLTFTIKNTNVVHPDFPRMRTMVKDAIKKSNQDAKATKKDNQGKGHGKKATKKPTPKPTPSDDSLVNVKNAC